MVQVTDEEVKVHPLVKWVLEHPRTGWWLAAIGLVNICLNLLDLFIRG